MCTLLMTVQSLQECWSQDASSRPGFQHVIVSIRGLLEGATNKQKMQKTLTGLLPCVPHDMPYYLSGHVAFSALTWQMLYHLPAYQ